MALLFLFLEFKNINISFHLPWKIHFFLKDLLYGSYPIDCLFTHIILIIQAGICDACFIIRMTLRITLSNQPDLSLETA